MFLKKKLESGRSMVEMLGVLAIIGVLSIGGIAGYTLSMRRYRANQIIDMANKYALIVYGACQKALLDGDISALNGPCINLKPYPTFAESGLGTIADATKIEFGSISDADYSDGSFNVRIDVTFQDNEICKTVKNITKSLVPNYSCGTKAGDYWYQTTDINIKMN